MVESENIVSFFGLLQKYRIKIILLLLIPVVLAIGVYFFSDNLISYIVKPLKGNTLFFMTPVEGILAKMKVALFGGVVLSLPFLAFGLVLLFSGKLKKKRVLLACFLVIPFATLSFAGGVYFGYNFVIPVTINFLLNVSNDFLNPLLNGNDYFSFVLWLLTGIGIVFELPIILVGLSRLGIVNSKKLNVNRKFAIIGILTVMAVVTPTPDAFTLLVASLPMVLLYEVSIWWIFILEKLDKKRLNG